MIPTATTADLLATLLSALRSRDREERADLLGEAVDGGATTRFAELAAVAQDDEILALCLLARAFSRHVALAEVTPWQAHDDPQVRAAAVATIALRKVDDGVRAAASRGLADPEPGVRIAALRAIRDNRDAGLLALTEALRHDPDEAVRRWVDP